MERLSMVTLTAKKTPITVAYGDGIGPEIMDATLNHALQFAGKIKRHEAQPTYEDSDEATQAANKAGQRSSADPAASRGA